jgi:uncharacterized protein YgiB involved in biofilm formation
MKRTASVTLALLGAAGLLASCGDPEPDIKTAAFKDTNECISSGQYTSDECDSAFKAAEADSNKNAPAFKTQDDCEDEFGKERCKPTTSENSSGTGFFMPYMMGYMMGSSSHGYSANDTFGNRQQYASTAVPPQALYNSTKVPGYVNTEGAFVTPKTGGFTVSPRADVVSHASNVASAGKTSAISRGGFGARAVAISS